ncbi:hypothetical protein AVXHC19_00260 [Acidovorax sacchari]
MDTLVSPGAETGFAFLAWPKEISRKRCAKREREEKKAPETGAVAWGMQGGVQEPAGAHAGSGAYLSPTCSRRGCVS